MFPPANFTLLYPASIFLRRCIENTGIGARRGPGRRAADLYSEVLATVPSADPLCRGPATHLNAFRAFRPPFSVVHVCPRRLPALCRAPIARAPLPRKLRQPSLLLRDTNTWGGNAARTVHGGFWMDLKPFAHQAVLGNQAADGQQRSLRSSGRKGTRSHPFPREGAAPQQALFKFTFLAEVLCYKRALPTSRLRPLLGSCPEAEGPGRPSREGRTRRVPGAGVGG